MLSEHERSEKVQRGRELIEEFLRDLKSEYGVSAEEQTLSNGNIWLFNLHNNPMVVGMVEMPANELFAGIIRIDANVAELPTRNLLPLYRHLLEMNQELVEGAFTVGFDSNRISIRITRYVGSVDTKEEFARLVWIPATYREIHMDNLSNEFGCIPLGPWELPAS